MVVDGSRLLVVGGYGGNGQPVLTQLLVVRLSDGAFDPEWQMTTWESGGVVALALDANEVYVGGGFASINGQARTGLARLSRTTGELDATWKPQLEDVPGQIISGPAVKSIAPLGDRVYIAGQFGRVGDLDRLWAAAVSASGAWATDALWNPRPSGEVKLMATADPRCISAVGLR